MSGRRAAPRPADRTVTVTLDGGYAGWEATARADFAASQLADLQSGDIAKVIVVLQDIISDHNLPTREGEVAVSLGDVDPYEGLLLVAAGLFEQIGKLPNR